MAKLQKKLTSAQTKIWLMYVRQHFALYSRVSMNILREVCGYLHSAHFLPCIVGNNLCLHELETGSFVRFTLGHTFTVGTVFCLYRDRQLLSAGGDPQTCDAWSISVDTGTVAPLPQMQFERAWSGIVNFQEAVYVFGGNLNPSLISCEVMDTGLTKWRRLPDMNSPRTVFTPAVYKNEIYLACSMPANYSFEAFNPVTETYRSFPAVIDSMLYGCVSFIVQDSLTIITCDKILMSWKLDSEEGVKDHIQLHIEKYVMSNIPVTYYEQKVWWVNYFNGEVVQFDVEKKTIRLVAFGKPIS